MLSNNSGSKEQKSLAHFLHRQWIATKGGQEQHKKDRVRMRALPVKALKGKGRR